MSGFNGSGGSEYDAIFLDVDGTLTWVDLDVEGYASDLAPYCPGGLSASEARGPVWQSIKTHIRENINYRTTEELRAFKRRNALQTAGTLGIRAPEKLLVEVADRRMVFTPYPESETVLRELKATGIPLYIVSNWDILLRDVLDDLGWLGFFEGIIASAVVGLEKPDPGIFREALRLSGTEPSRTIHVGNDSNADVLGASEAGLDTFFVDRKGEGEVPGATFTGPDLTTLVDAVRG
ncbi:HAD family hydrolase [Rubrobacter indicoceani]|uniref:HAD family hydrolase n=1 Tax=Rubrobacter indicoceani TaxID=2051957 RepID=UPI000E5AA95B|nr:HAD family hydrolase [Rubrobacter indicoceani]